MVLLKGRLQVRVEGLQGAVPQWVLVQQVVKEDSATSIVVLRVGTGAHSHEFVCRVCWRILDFA